MKNKEMVNEQSHVNPRSSQVLNQAVNQEEDKKENASEVLDKGEQEIRSQGNYSRQVQEEDAPSPIEIAKAYMGSRPLNVVPSTSGFLRKSLHEDKHISLNIPVGDVQSSVAIASNFSEILSGSHDGYMTPKLQGSSAIYNSSRLPYFRSHMMTDIRRGSRPRKPSEWTPTSVFMHSVLRQAQKRGSLVLDNDRESGHSRRVRPKSCSTSLPLSSRTDSLSTTSCGPYNEQETTSFDVVEKSDNRKYLACVGYVPPKSTEMARKILLQLDKLVPSPKAKSSDKKVIIGDTSSSKSYLNTSHAGNSIVPRMIISESPFLDKSKGEVLPSSPLVESKATSSGIGFTHLPAQKGSTLQRQQRSQ
ncbi:hypothetical protein AXF42_Ash015016 [Apostasia shenzhenica]|uniref:Uncharacterized protein n=1 Tax=Apostasia shenzhenica TaxID=1088818 RepID=A0A2I0B2W3_9ASPA|nr:hypothetical protein AXF42_Ash015016 [Apostasia shenzhenica]